MYVQNYYTNFKLNLNFCKYKFECKLLLINYLLIDLLIKIIDGKVINASTGGQIISKQPIIEILNKLYIRPVPNLTNISL